MFDWSDFLDVAEALQTKDDQASLRTAVGRAYFAAYRTGHYPRPVYGRRGFQPRASAWKALLPFGGRLEGRGHRTARDAVESNAPNGLSTN